MKKPVIVLIVSVLILATIAIAGIIITLMATNNNDAVATKNAVTANFTIVDADYHPPTQNNKAVIEIGYIDNFVAYAKENNITTIYRGNVFRSYIFHPVYWFALNTTIICTELTR